MTADAPSSDAGRPASLTCYDILGTPPEPAYDDLVGLAQYLCSTPIAALNFIDDHRQWSKASVGMADTSLPLAASLCAHAVAAPHELLVVPDLRADPRFVDHPLVTGPAGLRFYAGAPLVTPDGEALGTLCVADQAPRTLSPTQLEALGALARQAVALLELRRTAAELRASEARFTAFLDNSPAVAFLKDDLGRMLYVNRPFERRFGLTRADWLGKDDFELWPETSARELRAHDLKVLAGDDTVELLESVEGADGEPSYWQSYKFPLQDGERKLLAGMAVDVTPMRRYELQLEAQGRELERLNALLASQSRTDALTGLYNRRAFEERLEADVAQARGKAQPLALLMLDVDYFKRYNDRFGHPAGDTILTQVAALLRANVRDADLVARYGGEEFVILLPRTGLPGARRLAERCRYEVATHTWPGQRVTVSLGVAILGPGVETGAALLEEADRALYAAKRAGRNRVAVNR